METSVLLAIHPDLVRLDAIEPPADVSPEGGAMFLRQRDLNTFGVGHFDAGGVVGYPSLASAEKGRQIVGGVRGRLLAHVRDRLQLLANVPRYAGAGGIAVRPMAAEDVAAGMRLKSQAGWNQTEEDWRRFLEGPPGSGGFAAVHNGRVVGTAAAIRYGDDLGWIGMMLVDAAFRRQGIGRLLLQHAVDHLSGCRAVKLDATPDGEACTRGLASGAKAACTA
jgi:GNAT superfamily N-acetyltransferase